MPGLVIALPERHGRCAHCARPLWVQAVFIDHSVHPVDYFVSVKCLSDSSDTRDHPNSPVRISYSDYRQMRHLLP